MFRASISVSFLLEVFQSPVRVSLSFICRSYIFQHNADQERAATGWKVLTNTTSKDICVVPRHASTRLSIRWSLPERERILGPLCQEECFFLLCMCDLLFLLETSGSFCKFNSFLFIYLFIFLNLILNLFIYLFVPYILMINWIVWNRTVFDI